MFLLDIHNHPWVEGTKAWQKKVRPVCRNCVETDLRNRMLGFGFVKNWDFQIWPKTAETWIGGTKGLASLAVCAVPRPLPIGKRWKTRSLAVCFALISARHCVSMPKILWTNSAWKKIFTSLPETQEMFWDRSTHSENPNNNHKCFHTIKISTPFWLFAISFVFVTSFRIYWFTFSQYFPTIYVQISLKSWGKT